MNHFRINMQLIQGCGQWISGYSSGHPSAPTAALIGGKKLADIKPRSLLATVSVALFTFFVDCDTDCRVIYFGRGN